MNEAICSRIPRLERRRKLLIDYLDDQVEHEDWHGVMDAAADLREIDAQLAVLRSVQ